MKKIWLSPPHMSGKERLYVEEAFLTNWIAPLGPNVSAFEEQLMQYTDRPALALNSGTSALHLALCVLNIQKGDVVFCQSLTFAASAFPVMYQQAVPVFIDSEPGSWNMDPAILEDALKRYTATGKKPAAIIVTHIYGMPADMNNIMKLSRQYNVPVVEDAAEAIGSVYNTIPCGSFGDMSVFSFNGNKIITTSGGGALLTEDKRLLEIARKLSTQAKEPIPHYEHKEIGYNYRMSNVCAGIGRGQMHVLEERVQKRREIFLQYKELLGDIEGIKFQREDFQSRSNRWLTVVRFTPSRLKTNLLDKIRTKLDENNIESRPVWKPMHRQPVFKDAPAFVNGVSDAIFESGICLPSGSSLTGKEIELIASIVKKTFKNEAVTV